MADCDSGWGPCAQTSASDSPVSIPPSISVLSADGRHFKTPTASTSSLRTSDNPPTNTLGLTKTSSPTNTLNPDSSVESSSFSTSLLTPPALQRPGSSLTTPFVAESTSATPGSVTTENSTSSVTLASATTPSSSQGSAIGSSSSTFASTAAPSTRVTSGSSTHAGPPIGVIISIPVVVLCLCLATAAVLYVLRRRRRNTSHTGAMYHVNEWRPSPYHIDLLTAGVGSGATTEHEGSLPPSSIIVISGPSQGHSAAATYGGRPDARAGSVYPASFHQTPWGPPYHAKAAQRSSLPALAASRPQDVVRASLGPETRPMPHFERSPPAPAATAETSDTVLLRLPVDLARGLVALVGGANVSGIRPAGVSGTEESQGTESLPAYETGPSTFVGNRFRPVS